MRADLSVQSIATVLAALGTSAVITACGGDAKPDPNSPVNATEVTPTSAAPAGPGSCGAHAVVWLLRCHAGGGSCGAHAPATRRCRRRRAGGHQRSRGDQTAAAHGAQ